MSSNKHADGWTSDEIYRSMRRNCEAYKKKSIDNIKLEHRNDNIMSLIYLNLIII